MATRAGDRWQHCFRTPTDVAAAAARISVYYEEEIRNYERARRIADAGGPLPVFGANEVGKVSDPDPNNCVNVATYKYRTVVILLGRGFQFGRISRTCLVNSDRSA